MKDWCNFVTKDYPLVDKSIVTWEKFVEKFKEDYVPLIEKERLAHEYLSLKQTTDSVTKITKMFTERVFILPKILILRTGADVSVPEHTQDRYPRVCIK